MNPVSCVEAVVVVAKLPDSCEPHVCCKCGTHVDVTFGPDPYDFDIHNDSTPVWECGHCRHESAMDV